jgi:hypothetical protein
MIPQARIVSSKFPPPPASAMRGRRRGADPSPSLSVHVSDNRTRFQRLAYNIIN